ncbi:zinc-finger domain-containing protein-containing protein [Coprinopsis cinerea AmutBmut pab1-1]|nr:zinc-finger domain-containing protein-containing protein [Coprinopsis cinerea AmutBmut pab1-1]
MSPIQLPQSLPTEYQIPCNQLYEQSDKHQPLLKCAVPGCAYTAPLKKSLTRHTRTPHNSCPEDGCTFSTTSKRELKRHTGTHRGATRSAVKNPPGHPCLHEGCTYVGDKRSLAAHQSAMHSSNPTKYYCDFEGCTYSGRWSQNLESHRRTHDLEKPFKCPFPGCNYSTRWKHNLTTHKSKKAHADMLKDRSPQPSPSTINPVSQPGHSAESLTLDHTTTASDSFTPHWTSNAFSTSNQGLFQQPLDSHPLPLADPATLAAECQRFIAEFFKAAQQPNSDPLAAPHAI